MPKQEFRIDLLGTSLLLKVDADPVYVKSLLTRYRQLLDKTQTEKGLEDPLKIALLTGFLLCDEIERLRAHGTGMEPLDALQAEKITLDLIEKIEKALPEDFPARGEK
jgi:IS5 family transposase